VKNFRARWHRNILLFIRILNLVVFFAKWHQYSGEVDYQYTVSCTLLFKCCLQ